MHTSKSKNKNAQQRRKEERRKEKRERRRDRDNDDWRDYDRDGRDYSNDKNYRLSSRDSYSTEHDAAGQSRRKPDREHRDRSPRDNRSSRHQTKKKKDRKHKDRERASREGKRDNKSTKKSKNTAHLPSVGSKDDDGYRKFDASQYYVPEIPKFGSMKGRNHASDQRGNDGFAPMGFSNFGRYKTKY